MDKVLFLVGPHASGKTYSTKEYIANKNDVMMIDTGPIMREIHNKMSPGTLMREWIEQIELNYGKDITSKLISGAIERIIANSDCNKFIVIGFRTLDGIKYTVRSLNLKNFGILYVDASQELLYQNYLTREKNEISFDDFKDYLQDELESGLGQIKKMALYDRRIGYYYRHSNYDNLKEKIDDYFNNRIFKKEQEESLER